MKNCNSTLPKHISSKPGGFSLITFHTTRAAIFVDLLIIASLLIFPSFSHVHALQPVSLARVGSFVNEPTLKTIIIDNYAPYTYVNIDGKPDGFSVDLMQAVAQVMGVKLEIQVDTWDNARHALDNGTIDFLPMMAYSTERDKLYDFSPTHTIAYDAFFARKAENPISSMADLSGKKVIVMESDQAHDYLKSLASLKAEQLILVNSLPEALRLLASGSGDTALMPKLVGLTLIRDLNLTNLEPSPVVVEAYNRPFSFAVKDGNQAVLERLDQGMSIVKATGQYDEIYKKWFGTLEPVGVTDEKFLKYLGGIVLAFLVIGAFLLLWSFSLRRQVAARTRSLELEIQERKQVEEALRKSTRRFGALLSQAPFIGVIYRFIRDESGNTIDWEISDINELGATSIGLTVETAIGKRAIALFSQKVMAPYFEIARQVEASDLPQTFETYFEVNGQYYLTSVFMVDTGYYANMSIDITRVKNAEGLLELSEARYRAILQSASDAIISVNSAGNIIGLNKAAEQLFGYSEQELKGQNLTILSPAANRDAHVAGMERVKAGGEKHVIGRSIEVDGLRKDESTIHLELSLSEWMVGDDQFFTGIIRDITERKLAEEALIHANERLSFAQRSSKSGVWDWDMTTGQLEWSPEFLILFGLDPATTPTFDVWRSVIHADDVQIAEDRINDSIREHTLLENNYRIVLPSGELRWINALGNTTYDEHGVPLRMSGICLDITERSQAEAALRESEKKYRLIAENTSDGIIIFGADSRIQYVSPGYLRQLGYSEIVELTRTTDSIYSSIHPDDRDVTFSKIYAAIELKQAGAIYSYRVKHAAGHYIWREDNAKFQYDSAGKYAGSYVICRDITERKRAEEQLNEQLEELRRWQNITQGREDRILQLKSEINRMLIEAGKPPRFASVADSTLISGVHGVNLETPGESEC